MSIPIGSYIQILPIACCIYCLLPTACWLHESAQRCYWTLRNSCWAVCLRKAEAFYRAFDKHKDAVQKAQKTKNEVKDIVWVSHKI